MKIISTEDEQNGIKIEEKTDTFENGDTISTIWLIANGTRISISVQNWKCGYNTSASINIHGMKDSKICIFEKTKKTTKKLKESNCYVTTIRSQEAD